jgi:hypothetical protein
MKLDEVLLKQFLKLFSFLSLFMPLFAFFLRHVTTHKSPFSVQMGKMLFSLLPKRDVKKFKKIALGFQNECEAT